MFRYGAGETACEIAIAEISIDTRRTESKRDVFLGALNSPPILIHGVTHLHTIMKLVR